MKFSKSPKNVRLAAVLFIAAIACTAQAQEIYREESLTAAVQLRTNGLYDLALCPNIGIEFQADDGLALQMDYIGAWWNNNSKHRYFSNYAFEAELRYYFKCESLKFPYTKHHIGVYGQMATYDFEFGGTGYLSRDLDFSFGVGVSYGYSLPIHRRWCLDFTLGIGYFQSKYDVYEPFNGAYVKSGTRRLRFTGPTKLEVTFVWNLNKNNRK